MSAPDQPRGSRWTGRADAISGQQYDDRWRALAAAGKSIHGEADFVCGFEPNAVLDAGCGTGRVAIELAARGIDVVGVDLDADMIAEARLKAPDLPWVHGDLLDVSPDDLPHQPKPCVSDSALRARYRSHRLFDVVVMAGNVMIFVNPGTERAVVANVAQFVRPGGVLVAGFQTDRGYTADAYDADCSTAGLAKVGRYDTWEAVPATTGSSYAVSVHRR